MAAMIVKATMGRIKERLAGEFFDACVTGAEVVDVLRKREDAEGGGGTR